MKNTISQLTDISEFNTRILKKLADLEYYINYKNKKRCNINIIKNLFKTLNQEVYQNRINQNLEYQIIYKELKEQFKTISK